MEGLQENTEAEIQTMRDHESWIDSRALNTTLAGVAIVSMVAAIITGLSVRDDVAEMKENIVSREFVEQRAEEARSHAVREAAAYTDKRISPVELDIGEMKKTTSELNRQSGEMRQAIESNTKSIDRLDSTIVRETDRIITELRSR